MKMWFAPGSEVPLYRQMGTQIVLAILSGDLKPGEKLPSTRALVFGGPATTYFGAQPIHCVVRKVSLEPIEVIGDGRR